MYKAGIRRQASGGRKKVKDDWYVKLTSVFHLFANFAVNGFPFLPGFT
jgi:hypothetical protein